MIIRSESPNDHDGIDAVVDLAFDGSVESQLIGFP
jgi:hypothetical protein